MNKFANGHVIAVKVLLSLCIFIYGGVVPIMEVNETHVFNPNWPPHALLHEVWQLITNSALAVMCLWFVWVRKEIKLPSLIGMIITGSFLLSFMLQGSYGGSMKYLDGTENTLFGVNLGLLIFGIVFCICAYSFVSAKQKS